MKLVIAILAVVACASTSILPHAQSLSVGTPLLAAHGWAAAPAWAAPAWAPASAWAHSAVWAAPAWAHGPAIIASPAEGKYVAANRGSVHVAPLPGHWQSATSLNLQPAPGTW